MTPKQILSAAADLLESKGWTKKASARDKNGMPCLVKSPLATSYCALGAIYVISGNRFIECLEALNTLHAEVGDISTWNDLSTGPAVINTLRKLSI